jgi:hypothetical protein
VTDRVTPSTGRALPMLTVRSWRASSVIADAASR